MKCGHGQRLLKLLHLLAVACWTGGCLSMLTLLSASGRAGSDAEFFGMLRAFQFVHTYIVCYIGAFGSFFTGLAYSFCTNRGFFRYPWIILKWVITLAMLLAGATLLGPWAACLLDTAQEYGLEALSDEDVARMRGWHLLMLCVAATLFIVLFALSVYKPGEKRTPDAS